MAKSTRGRPDLMRPALGEAALFEALLAEKKRMAAAGDDRRDADKEAK